MAHFSERVAAYLALQKKVEGKLPPQKETNNPEQIKAHVTALATGIRAARDRCEGGRHLRRCTEQFRHDHPAGRAEPFGSRRLRRDAGGAEADAAAR